MIKIRYNDRQYMSKYIVRDTEREIKCEKYKFQGGVCYLYNASGYVFEVLETSMILSIKAL